MQAAEIWDELGEWIIANKPDFGPGTKERFQMASKLSPEEVQIQFLPSPPLLCMFAWCHAVYLQDVVWCYKQGVHRVESYKQGVHFRIWCYKQGDLLRVWCYYQGDLLRVWFY